MTWVKKTHTWAQNPRGQASTGAGACVCVQSTNMFSPGSRRSNQSCPRNLSNSHPQKRLLPAGAAMSQQRQPGLGGWGVGKRQALALEPASPFSRPGRPAWVTALALMSENAFLELAGPGRSRVSPSSSLFLSCPHTRPFFFFSSRCKTKTPRSHEFRSCGQMAGASGAGCRSGTRHGSCPGLGWSCWGPLSSASVPRGSSVIAPGNRSSRLWLLAVEVGGTDCVHLCPPRAKPEVADMDNGQVGEPGMRGTTTINRGSTA